MGRLTLLVAASGSVGHRNACAGVTRQLARRGHRVVFFLDPCHRGTLAAQGFEEYIHDEHRPGEESASRLGEKVASLLGLGIEEQYRRIVALFAESASARASLRHLDEQLKRAVARVKPDCIVADMFCLPPSVHYGRIPWVRVVSHCPLLYTVHQDIPPGGCGLALLSDRRTWPRYRKCQNSILYSKALNDTIEGMGYPRYPRDAYVPDSQVLTVYAWPREMVLPQIKAEWVNLEVFEPTEGGRVGGLKETVPEDFLRDDLGGRFSGKLIYLTLGSLGSFDLALMRRLVAVLGRTDHKYLVSKGPRHAEYCLARNMWGEPFLPQLQLLPHVDLVVSHGGNNTLTESVARGKPVLVRPLFADQHDNAVRVEESRLGPHCPLLVQRRRARGEDRSTPERRRTECQTRRHSETNRVVHSTPTAVGQNRTTAGIKPASPLHYREHACHWLFEPPEWK